MCFWFRVLINNPVQQVCRNCTNKTYHPWLALFFTLFFGLVLVACAVALNLGVSPTLDSLLFFIQVCVCVCARVCVCVCVCVCVQTVKVAEIHVLLHKIIIRDDIFSYFAMAGMMLPMR